MAQVHASEGLHWYTREGKPAYTVAAKDGSQRPTTLRDARKLGLCPSVTTIIRCAAAPGLERWKLDQMLHAALTLPRMPDEKESDWISRVWTDSQETAKKAAEKGTAIHAAIQRYFEGFVTFPEQEDYQHIQGANAAVSNWTPYWHLMAETSFASPLGYGGKVDLSDAGFVIDFKTKEFDADTDLKTWPEHHMQLAAYRMGLEMPHAKAAIVYVSVTNPGLSKLIEIPEEDLKRGWECFKALLAFWQAKNNYRSSWEPEKEAA